MLIVGECLKMMAKIRKPPRGREAIGSFLIYFSGFKQKCQKN
jgi:hypothetical protein